MTTKMQSFFELNPYEIDNILPSITKNLQSQDENLQVKSIKTILKCFVDAESGGRDVLLVKFNRFGIMHILLNLLYSLNNRLSPCILDLLILAKDYHSFYIGETAILAIKVLINVSICLAKSTAEAEPMLEQCIVTMSTILKNTPVSGERLKTVHTQILHFVKIIYGSPNDIRVRLLATQLFNIIIARPSTREDIELLNLCLEALDFINKVIDWKDGNVSVIDGLSTLCTTCAFGSRYCTSKQNENNENLLEIQRCKESLGNAIYCSIIYAIIPQAMTLELDNENEAEFQSDFVASLSALYQLNYCNHDELSRQLTANGYLKYFLRLSVNVSFSSSNLRHRICLLLPEVLFRLEKMSAPPGRNDEVFEFSDKVHELESLPMNPNDWFFPGRIQINSQSTFLALIYHHYRRTHETEVISYEYFVVSLAVLQQQPQSSWQDLRALWFLLAVMYTRQEMTRSHTYYEAINRLTSALSQSNLSDCYTHHFDLVRFCLDCAEFPVDLQRAVLRLWLLQCNGDVKPLFQLNHDKVLHHLLFVALHTPHQDSGLTSLVKIIREFTNTNTTVGITKITWDILLELLFNYHPNKNEYLKLLLEFTLVSNTGTLPMSTIQNAAEVIVKIVLRVPWDTKLKTLLITQAQVLLDESLTRNAIQVLETYVSARVFLESLWNDAFTMKDLELTVTCLKLSVLIVQCQHRKFIQFEQPAEVKMEHLADLLFRGRNIAEVRYSGLLLLLEFLQESDESLAIRLAKINPDSEEAMAIIDLLEGLYILTGKGDFKQTGLVYQCLIELFNFCHRRAKRFMLPLCTNLSTCSVFDYVFELDLVTSDILHFVSCWLRYRAIYCTAEGRWRPTSLCKTPYEETIDRIKKYVEKQDTSRLDDAYCKLRSALSETL